MSYSIPSVARFSRLSAIVLLVLICGRATATDMEVGTEFIYPTEFEIVPGQISSTAGGGSIVQETVVIPRSFATREVGIKMSVEAIISSMNAASASLRSLQQRQNGNTDLMLAATAGNYDAVKWLLMRGGNVNAKNNAGATALMGASAGGFEFIVRLLLQQGANVTVKSSTGSTALMYAARNGHLGVVQALLEKGANVNDSDQHGLKPLMYAVLGGDPDVVKLLIEKGADVKAADPHGFTPVMLANERHERDIVVLLTQPQVKKQDVVASP